ncbi:MAG: hypothetical protein A2Y12_08745 [Planctomycetes bacterium GWF2_42_9]|nr:MAG: hypothetical protein A2Y12_08745 [Planctomycetes bacterium GWF2_42_9]
MGRYLLEISGKAIPLRNKILAKRIQTLAIKERRSAINMLDFIVSKYFESLNEMISKDDANLTHNLAATKNRSVIQVKIFDAGITQKQISEKSGFSEVSVYYTIRHRTHNQIIQEAIAELLNIPAEQLWGEHYAPVWRKKNKNVNGQRS